MWQAIASWWQKNRSDFAWNRGNRKEVYYILNYISITSSASHPVWNKCVHSIIHTAANLTKTRIAAEPVLCDFLQCNLHTCLSEIRRHTGTKFMLSKFQNKFKWISYCGNASLCVTLYPSHCLRLHLQWLVLSFIALFISGRSHVDKLYLSHDFFIRKISVKNLSRGHGDLDKRLVQ